MVHRKNACKLLLFPAPKPALGSADGNWSRRILETKDNLTSALEFLRIAYNEMLAGRPVKSVDEVLDRVEAIVRNDAKIPAYTVVAAIRIHGSISPKPKVLLLFPAV
jgi:nitrogen-specific signal transduction histidine kinase